MYLSTWYCHQSDQDLNINVFTILSGGLRKSLQFMHGKKNWSPLWWMSGVYSCVSVDNGDYRVLGSVDMDLRSV